MELVSTCYHIAPSPFIVFLRNATWSDICSLTKYCHVLEKKKLLKPQGLVYTQTKLNKFSTMQTKFLKKAILEQYMWHLARFENINKII